ncbi:uncharacterized protein LY89DRAFT_726697, partial [Mollisia scopiformis]
MVTQKVFHRDPPLHFLPIRHINEKVMAAANKGHLHEEELTGDAQKAAQKCREFLLQARYRHQGDYEICNDSGLKENSRAFYAEFAPLVKTQNSGEIRLTALRFTKRATLPVKAGATIDLIPVIISQSPTVSNKTLRLGWSLHLTQDEIVELECYCLAMST